MKNPKDIKYETGEYDEEGNPIYITEAEFREHGIYTEEPPEYVVPTPVEKDRINKRVLISAILLGLLIFFISAPFVFGMVQVLMLGIGLIPYDLGEAIGLIIISIGAMILDLGFAIFIGRGRYIRLTSGFDYSDKKDSDSDKKESDDISGTYKSFGYTRPDGTKITHISKKK